MGAGGMGAGRTPGLTMGQGEAMGSKWNTGNDHGGRQNWSRENPLKRVNGSRWVIRNKGVHNGSR